MDTSAEEVPPSLENIEMLLAIGSTTTVEEDSNETPLNMTYTKAHSSTANVHNAIRPLLLLAISNSCISEIS